MFDEACHVYRDEGGQGELLKINVKVFYLDYHLTGRIEFRIQHTENQSLSIVVGPVHLFVVARLLSIMSQMTKLWIVKRDVILRFHILLLYLNSKPSFRVRRLILRDFNSLLRVCKISVGDLWGRWKKHVKQFKF